ncbi:unnamed protein product [Darwinula stevensoni]|uniref:F-box domain-containing protein n=1 Tax=Darwinula stevensoni TaxID=69355 RepID=A0A7R9FS63_9CRUS|nr:unnamed protein product [Darwinula stevensoni]CAG0903134.1 unnamed protein product [Darwinula stevensoni]
MSLTTTDGHHVGSVKSFVNGYGCPVILERWKLGSHLADCPASVVVCPVEWNRWKLTVTQRPMPQFSSQVNYDQLDVALALRDQRSLNKALKLPRRVLRALRSPLTCRYPASPLILSSIEDLDDEADSSLSQHTITEDDEFAPCQIQKSPPGLQSSVCNRLAFHDKESSPNDAPSLEPSPRDEVHWEKNLSHIPPLAPPLPSGEKLTVDLIIENRSKDSVKSKSMYTFLCAQEVRRSDFPWHYKNVHADIQANLNGWLETRCPMWQYGCRFCLRRFHPHDPRWELHYDDLQESFAVAVRRETVAGEKNLEPVQGLNILMLPFEMLVHICSFLDGISLNNMALTCRDMREVCRSLLEEKGIVSLVWQRIRSPERPATWEVAYKVM